jgi:hypothetical protein
VRTARAGPPVRTARAGPPVRTARGTAELGALAAAIVKPVTDTRPDEDVRFVIQRELSLVQPGATAQVEALLHPDFCEVGPSGCRLGRREAIVALATRQVPPAPGNGTPSATGPAAAAGLTGIRLSGTVILVSYVSEQDGQRSHRSSLWLKTGPSWRRYFHQATLITVGKP